MDFTFSDEQQQLRATLRAYLRKHYSFADRRAATQSPEGLNADIWRDFAGRLGLLSLADPDHVPDPVDLMIIMEELGEALVVEPFLETIVIGTALLRHDGGEIAKKLMRGVAAGNVRLAFAWAEPQTRYSWTPRQTTAKRDGEEWVLDGVKSVVVGAPWATDLIVSAATSEGTSLFLVAPDAPGLSLVPYPTIDGRRAADLLFDGVRLPAAALLGENGSALEVLNKVEDAALAAIGAEAVGVTRRMLQDTIAYTKQRKQFGKALSDFQALQHRMVDMFMHVEMLSSAVYLATLKLGAEPQERRRAASVAKTIVGEACRFVGQNAVQLHGGIGMTDDLAVGHYFKRATVIEAEFGTVDHHIDRFSKANAA